MEFTHNNRTFLAIEVPEGATNYRLQYEEVLHKKVLYFDLGGLTFNQFVTGVPDFKILSLLKDATEEQCKEMVNQFYDFDGIKGWDDTNKLIWNTALQALASRLASLGMDTTKNILIIEKI